MVTILKSESLGEIRGTSTDGITQYLGLKYATLQDRFAVPELVKSKKGDILDATKHGPSSLSVPAGCDIELGHVQKILSKTEVRQSDINCLNLNIAVPSSANPESKLPVLFFIHGGGFIIGSNSWPQYDLARLAKLSVERHLPMVIVTINYRLGAPGFLTSKEMRKAGYKPNNGLRDQRVALEWVQTHIRDFGGDPTNVAAIGQSAGGASITYHLQSKMPLFKRAIVMSGTSLLLPGLSETEHEENYRKAMAALGLSQVPATDRMKALLEMPGDRLVAGLSPSTLFAPALDGDLVPAKITHSELFGNPESDVIPGNQWCRYLLIGDSDMDASIFEVLTPRIKENITQKFIAAIERALASHPVVARRLLNSYGITKDTTDKQATLPVLAYLNDLLFNAPTLLFARGWKGKSYIYYFNEGNPWSGPWEGRANHILDVIYLFQNLGPCMNEDQQEVGTTIAMDFFKFCYGLEPWPAIIPGGVDNEFPTQIYGPSQRGAMTTSSNQTFGGDTMRRKILFDCAMEVSFDLLVQVFDELMSL